MENYLQIDSSMQRQRALVEFHGRHFGFYFSFGPTDAIRTRLYASHGRQYSIHLTSRLTRHSSEE
jgi:hypothetical protein